MSRRNARPLDVSAIGVSTNIQTKMPLSRTSAAAAPRSSTKLASTSGRRHQQLDKTPHARSVTNFPRLRKENTKPYAAAAAFNTYTHSRSTNEETTRLKEDKPRWRSQSSRKTSPESSEDTISLKQLKNMEPKRLLRKNNAKLKGSVASEALKKEEEDEAPSMVKDDLKEEFGKNETKDQVVDESESRMSHESKKLMDSKSEHCNTSQSVDQTSVAVLSGENPMSWNSRTDRVSDVESPTTSPASWNPYPTEARTRKLLGITQKPNIVPSSSDFKSHKDMTKGFKRLLKFGKKSRHAESLADHNSATTSEGNDDTEDRRDPANRSSKDLRKSRMGYSHESDFYADEVHKLQSSITKPPANFRLREVDLRGSSIKAPRSFFSFVTIPKQGK